MLIYKRLAIFLAFILILSAIPAGSQSGQNSQKKVQEGSGASVVKSSPSFRVRLGGFTFGASYRRYSGYYLLFLLLLLPFLSSLVLRSVLSPLV